MSYSYSSYEQTTTTINGRSTTTTRTTTSSGDSSSVVVRELTESEVSQLSLSDSPSPYEIADEDCLTKYDFYQLMNSEDDLDSETESESDVEYHWFPSLLRRSVIKFLDDKEQEMYMDDDTFDNKVQIIENTSAEEDEDEEEEEKHVKKDSKKRHFKRHGKSHKSKRPKKSEQVPVEVVHIVL